MGKGNKGAVGAYDVRLEAPLASIVLKHAKKMGVADQPELALDRLIHVGDNRLSALERYNETHKDKEARKPKKAAKKAAPAWDGHSVPPTRVKKKKATAAPPPVKQSGPRVAAEEEDDEEEEEQDDEPRVPSVLAGGR